MAHVRKGHLTRPPEWWKHLRWVKKLYWNREKQAVKKMLRKDVAK